MQTRLMMRGQATLAQAAIGLALVLALVWMKAPRAELAGALAERMVTPPSDARITKIIHGWPDDSNAQDALIRQLRDQGFGGVVCNVSFDQYLEDDGKWASFTRAVKEANRRGMAMWLYDERGYPSGNAGGLVLRGHADWEARGLLVANQEFEGAAVELMTPPGRLVLAAAFPVHDGRIDLTGKVQLDQQVHDGRLRWQAPAGRWHVMLITEDRLYNGTHADGNLWQKMPYINLLMPEPTSRFLELTHARYARHLGDDLGRYFLGTFTDEPSLMSCFLRPMPYRPLPWSSNLPTEFQKRRGYALTPELIPALAADAGPDAAKTRYDFWQTVGELVSENYFGQVQRWCRDHQVPSGGHLLMEEGFVAHAPLYGDFFRCVRRLDAPGIDCLTSVPAEVPWFIARLVASAAELEGGTLVMSETSDHSQVWRAVGDQRPKRVVTEAEIRGTCNRLMVSGVNSITSYYSFNDLSGAQIRRLNEWVGRCCAMLRGGRQVADVAVLYPIESIWTQFVPARAWASDSPGAARIETICRSSIESLFRAQRDFTFIDSRTLAEGAISRGFLQWNDLQWRIVVLPGVDTLPAAAWQNLARFVRAGGAVIALGALPANSDSEFPSTRVQTLARELFGADDGQARVTAHSGGGAAVYLPAGAETLLPRAVDGLIEPDVRAEPARAPLRVTHRRIDDREVYFVVNDSCKSWKGQVQFAAGGKAELWNPATGAGIELQRSNVIDLRLGPYDAALVRFAEAKQPGRKKLTSGHLPGLVRRTLPPAAPMLAAGEHVTAKLRPATSNHDAPAWTATAVLRKSQVDTYLFVRLPYRAGLDLSAPDCLALETWAPAGQNSSTQVLVILHERDGGDFLASTGRSLAAAGRNTVYLPFSRFQLAGWSKDADGELDLSKIDEVRVGWGGYLGIEGETVEFSFALPQSAGVGELTD